MEADPEGVYRSFNASPQRLAVLRRLILDFAGVAIHETPIPGDFMTRVRLRFSSAEQGEAFIGRMLELGRQEIPVQDPHSPRRR